MIDSNNQFNKLTRSLIEATRNVMEKKTNKHGHDAVGHEDPDIDNDGDTDKSDTYLHNRRKAIAKSMKKEDVEVIDELSKKTLGSYIKKASGAEKPKNVMDPKNIPLTKIAAYQGDSETGHFGKRFNQATYDKAERLHKNRSQGITRAADKLTKEDVEAIDELSTATLKSYRAKARADAFDADDVDDNRRFRKRATGSNEAGKKLVKRGESLRAEEVEAIDEALSASDRYKHHHDNAKNLLKSIGEHLKQNHEAAHKSKDHRGNKGPNWGHVGSMEHYAQQLSNIHDQLARTGEYAMHESIEEAKVDGVAAGSMDDNGHLCATKVFHKEWAEGTPIFSQHAEPDVNGDIAWYDVMFEHGIEKGVSIEDLDVLMTETHERHGKRKMKEDINTLAKAALASLEEARGRPRKNPLPTGQSDEPEPRQHIMQQLQRAKLSMRGGEHVTFKDGTKHHVSGHHAEKILAKYSAMKPAGKEEFQKKIGASHTAFKEEL